MNNKVWEAWAIQQNFCLMHFVGQVFMFNNHIKAHCSMGVSVFIDDNVKLDVNL